MKGLSVISETLFIPLAGRIYVSKQHPKLLNDTKALEIESQIDKEYLSLKHADEYSLLASAVRNSNFYRIIQAYLNEKQHDVAIINLGSGLDTTCYRMNLGSNNWFDVDLENVIEMRRRMLSENGNIHFLAASVFEDEWIKIVKEFHPRNVLVVAMGFFYYFEKAKIVDFIDKIFSSFANVDVAFDTVSKAGLFVSNKIVSQMGKKVIMHFYVNDTDKFANSYANHTVCIPEERFYTRTLNQIGSELKLKTRLFMKISNWLNMVKIVHLKREN